MDTFTAIEITKNAKTHTAVRPTSQGYGQPAALCRECQDLANDRLLPVILLDKGEGSFEFKPDLHRIAGSKKSKAKAEAARLNGAKGGRPKKYRCTISTPLIGL